MKEMKPNLRLLPWRLRPAAPGLPLAERVLAARGLEGAEARRFLLRQAPPVCPADFRELDKAVALIEEVVSERGRIQVFGDYDADGLTATAILWRFFQALGLDLETFIPNRLEEGYGLTDEQVDHLLESPPDLLITVDCGSSSVAEVRRLRAAGVRVLVTDHHDPGAEIVAADAHLNPLLEAGIDLPLAGAAVAYLLCLGVASQTALCPPVAVLESLKVLAAVGTVADVMPLRGWNRSLVHEALLGFFDKAPPGLQALVRKKEEGSLRARDVAFQIAPRLNSAGRLGEAADALELLCTDDPEKARELAGRLEEQNEERRRVENRVFTAAREFLSEQEPGPLILVWGQDWHTGVLGIVAARLAERYARPALVLSLEDGVYRGSARSPGQFDLISLLRQAEDLMTRLGGHRSAAGLSFPSENRDAVVQRLMAAAASIGQDEYALEADLQLTPEDLEETPLRSLAALEPLGAGNETPLCLLPEVTLQEVRTIGDGRHVRLGFTFGGPKGMTIFSRPEVALLYQAGDRIEALVEVGWQVYRGRGQANLIARALRPAASGDWRQDDPEAAFLALKGGAEVNAAGHAFHAADFGLVYRALQVDPEAFAYGFSARLMARWIKRAYNGPHSGLALLLLLDILQEAGLGRLAVAQGESFFVAGLPDGRPTLSSLEGYQRLEEKGWLLP